MKVVYHPAVQKEVNSILRHYDTISQRLGDGFWDELMERIQTAARNPEHFHLALPNLRRVNLHRYPYHFLYRVLPDRIRITVVRHNRRHPGYGMNRH